MSLTIVHVTTGKAAGADGYSDTESFSPFRTIRKVQIIIILKDYYFSQMQKCTVVETWTSSAHVVYNWCVYLFPICADLPYNRSWNRNSWFLTTDCWATALASRRRSTLFSQRPSFYETKTSQVDIICSPDIQPDITDHTFASGRGRGGLTICTTAQHPLFSDPQLELGKTP